LFQRVLFPTDFSETSRRALGHAREITRVFGASLHCLHVVDDAYQYWSTFGSEGMPIGPPPEELLGLGRSRMEQFHREFLADIQPLPITHVAMGRPFAEIIGYARENQIDLIVMATHGRGAISHLLLGGTTEKVVRKARCAVMTVRVEGHEFVMP
jgi:nucleotide-binding universal stress UspA family protein